MPGKYYINSTLSTLSYNGSALSRATLYFESLFVKMLGIFETQLTAEAISSRVKISLGKS